MKGRVIIALSAATIISAASIYAYSKPRYDTLTKVIDGDTIIINGKTHVRLFGVDAPELDQTCERATERMRINWGCGTQAKHYLESFFMPQVKLQCTTKGHDIYGRTVAICYTINNAGIKHDIGKSMVAAGYALDWPEFSKGYYRNDEDYAKKSQAGMWSSSFVPPWEWRKWHKQ